MKQKLISLLTALVMALALCATAGAESGSWGGGGASAPATPKDPVWISGLPAGQTGLLAGYDDAGRMVGLRIFSADGVAAAIPGATSYKLLCVDTALVPQAPAFALDQTTGVVRKANGQVCICYDGPEGLGVTVPVTEKVTGTVSIISGSKLTINGTKYSATGLTVEGCGIPISAEGFKNWVQNGGSLAVTYDFYLDASGAICWIDQLEDTKHQPCLPLAANMEDGSLRVLVRMGVRTDVFTVTQLDGKAIGDGPDRIALADALAQLEADCEKAFYTYSRQAGDGGYHLVRASKDSPVDTGCAWGESYLIPEGSAIQPDADFSFGAVPCLANADTTFGLYVGDPERKEFFHYTGFQRLPFVQARGCVITRPDGVADIVYLDVPYFAAEPPEGCVLITSTGWVTDSEFYEDHVCLVNIVGTDGTAATLRVPEYIASRLSGESMRLDQLAHNTYAGQFCRVVAMDQDGVALGLMPVDAAQLQSMDNGEIVTAAGSWQYDANTKFFYADLGWEDNIDDPSNQIDVREPDKDLWVLWDSGVFDPNGGFHPDEVGEGQLYSSVRAAVLPAADDETLAQYVYVIRECN